MKMMTLLPEQLASLRTFANANGVQWKSKLNAAWATGRYRDYLGSETYAGSDDDAAACEVAIAAPLGSLRRMQARARCAEILNERAKAGMK